MITVYVVGLFQGLSLVAFPAAASIPQSSTGYDLSKSRYGLLFLPQVIMAIAGSLSMPTLARRFRLKRVLIAGLVADTVAMSLRGGAPDRATRSMTAGFDRPGERSGLPLPDPRHRRPEPTR